MFRSTISVLLVALATLTAQGQAVDPTQPTTVTRSPQEIAAANPNLSNEMRGDIMMARKMYREAIDFYKIEADKNALMANKTGVAYHQLGDLDNARKYYEKAMKIDKLFADAINNRGTVNYAKKSYWRASRDYEKALELNPESATIWVNLGTSYFARKRYDDAFVCYINALTLDPMIFEKRGTGGSQVQDRTIEERAKFFYMLAKTYAQAGLSEPALRYIRFALENQFAEAEKFLEEKEFQFLAENEEFVSMIQAFLASQEQSAL